MVRERLPFPLRSVPREANGFCLLVIVQRQPLDHPESSDETRIKSRYRAGASTLCLTLRLSCLCMLGHSQSKWLDWQTASVALDHSP